MTSESQNPQGTLVENKGETLLDDTSCVPETGRRHLETGRTPEQTSQSRHRFEIGCLEISLKEVEELCQKNSLPHTYMVRTWARRAVGNRHKSQVL